MKKWDDDDDVDEEEEEKEATGADDGDSDDGRPTSAHDRDVDMGISDDEERESGSPDGEDGSEEEDVDGLPLRGRQGGVGASPRCSPEPGRQVRRRLHTRSHLLDTY